MLEAHIAPQWSINYGGANGIVRKISEGHCLRFILTNSLTLYVSDEIHEAMREADEIAVDDEMCFGSYFPLRDDKILMQDDLDDKKPQTEVLTPILLKKLADFMNPFDRHVAIDRLARERYGKDRG